MSGFAERLATVRADLDAACARAHRDPGEVTLVAVSKTHPDAAVREAFDAGCRDFGENYAQALRDRVKTLGDLEGVRWHFLGPVQTNKVRYLVGPAAMVHAVDRLEVARALSERALRDGAGPVPCLLAVNVGGEASKSGVAPGDLEPLWRATSDLPGISVEGLFCIPPAADDPEASRPHFRRLRTLRDALRAGVAPSDALPHLSMGMSHDYIVAVEEGATLVRVGTALFGRRTPGGTP